jgi:tRNA (guanosine-2'-O-)-methyltransferase
MLHFVDMTPERRNKLTTVLSKRQPDLTVVLENVFDPHNVSAVMRTCDAVGVQEVHILNTKIPRHEKWGFKSSSSAAKWMTVHQYDNAAECFADLRKKYHKIMTTHLSSDATGLYEMDMTESIALVFGNEHSGVSEEIRGLADGNFLIPQVGIIQSLNISVACAVTLYEAYRQKTVAGHYTRANMEHAMKQQLLEDWSLKED